MTAAKHPGRTGVAVVLAALAFCAPNVARADAPTQAEGLFQEGRALLDAKKFDEACPKLAESQKLEPGAGTLLALALCHEGQGKTATASAELKRASELGQKVGRTDLAAAADRRAQALEASVPHLVIRLPEAKEASAYRVRCDGEAIARSELGAPVAMDPGEHRVEIAADGKMTRSYVVRLSGAGSVEIVVDKLDDVRPFTPIAAPTPKKITAAPRIVSSSPEDPHDQPENRGGGQRTLGLIIAGTGIVALGAGAYFGGRALSQSGEASRACPTVDSCPNGNDASERSKDSFRVSVVSLAAGTGALTLGSIIYFLAPSKSTPRADTAKKPPRKTARVVPAVSPTNVGFSFAGTF